ncbi:MAG: hypothetical protein AB8H47_26070 [Bacteroidia bacterium]
MFRTKLLLRAFCCGLIFLGFCSTELMAQTEIPKNLHINGLGRTLIQRTQLGGTISETDTTTAGDLMDGEFLLDLKINATPNKNSEVQSILRLRNEFGGFFGSGMSIEVRELFARGIVGNSFRYHVGDMDLKMTPYTLFQSDAGLSVNQAEIFRARQELIDYEQFYNGDGSRRMQGANLDFGLSAGSLIPEINLNGFFARVRGTDFFTLPTRFVSGGSIELKNPRWGSISGHYVNTFDAISIGDFENGIRNPVRTISADINILENDDFALGFVGEMGSSSIFETDSIDGFDRDDTFAEGSIEFELKPQNLTISVGFRDVGPDFFSIGAQSNRLDLNRSKSFYNRLGNDRLTRQTSIFDINRDRSLYTYALSDVLRPYDPRFGNTQPYGRATANRRGIVIDLDYHLADSALSLGADFMQMSEIRGQGSNELKSFTLAKVWGDVNIHRWIGSAKTLTLTLGYQFEQTQRGGIEIEALSLTSNLLEAGLQAELFEGFDLLFGIKQLSSTGDDYIPDVVRFNEVRDFPGRYVVDDTETMLAAGFRYRFSSSSALNIQWEQFSSSRATEAERAYQINQIFILYSLYF